jgi:hypothetical protein
LYWLGVIVLIVGVITIVFSMREHITKTRRLRRLEKAGDLEAASQLADSE